MAGALQPTEPRAAHAPDLETVRAAFPQYEVLALIGTGGMGAVFKVRQPQLDRFVALKILAPERVDDPRFAERFQREAQALARLSHPHIVTIHDFGQSGGFYFLLMEFVDGVNLRQAMRAGRFTPDQALAIVPPVCEALQYAHERGIVHRDIKPENLLLDREGRVKIADFGIAKMLGAESSIGLAETLAAGTPHYMAPEQKEQRTTDHRADIYSLGVVLYELLTGETPGDKLQPPSRRVQLDVRLDAIVLRALESAPELRYQTAGEFRTQVETLASTSADSGSKGAALPPATAPFLKLSTSTLVTPEELGTFSGQFFAYQTRGQLILDARQLTHTRAGHTTVIPLTAIRDVSLGQYPRSMNPAGVSLVCVTYEEAGERRQVLLSPMEWWFGLPSTWNANAADWHAAIRAAVKAATGREPSTTPHDQLGIRGGRPWLLIAMVAVPLLAGLELFLFILGKTGNSPRSMMPYVVVAAAVTLGFILPAFFIPWVMRRRPATPPSTPGSRSPLWSLFFSALCVPLLINLATPGSGFFIGLPESIILLVLVIIALVAFRRRPFTRSEMPPLPRDAARVVGSEFTAVALTVVWWFAAFPFVSYAADALRRPDTHVVAAVLMLIALPIFGAIAKGRAEAWIATHFGRRWLRAFSVIGWLIALPALGLAVFFFYSALSESGSWEPAPSEAIFVPVTYLGAVLLPIAATVLWAASSERPRYAASTAIRGVGVSLLCGLCFAGGLLILEGSPYAGRKVDAQLMPVRVVGRAVILRLITGEKCAVFELRPTLESPEATGAAAESLNSEIIAFRQEKGAGLFTTPRDRVGSPVAVTLGARFDIPIAFILPTPELAQQAFENLHGLGPIELTPDRPHRAIIFKIGAGGGRFIAALRFSTPIRKGHARWAEIKARPHVDTPSTLDLSWDLRTSRPAAFTLGYRDPLGGGGEAITVINQPGPERGVYQQTARVILYQMSPARVGLRTMLGNQPNTAEFDGDFATLAGEMRAVRFMQNLRTERDWNIELCRVAGNPVLVRVADPPAPTIVPAPKAQTNPAREAPAEPANAFSPPLRR